MKSSLFLGALAVIAAVSVASAAAQANASDRVGDAYDIIVEKCVIAAPGASEVCSRQVVRERVVRVDRRGLELSYSLQSVEVVSERANGAQQVVNQCHFLSEYLLFPARIRVADGALRSVRYPDRVDAECGGPSILASPEIDDFQRGCRSQAQCSERRYAEVYAPYLAARANAEAPVELSDYQGRTIRLTRTPSEQGA